ncbi:hypothetical protein Rhal01_03744 [Rubritalea halochordaticola]|uniref:Uncharacterized protein n=1 Tax=Rubritalea halochordaticola TaxID=714537 RepID=A0ABP9V4R9_9BACT
MKLFNHESHEFHECGVDGALPDEAYATRVGVVFLF